MIFCLTDYEVLNIAQDALILDNVEPPVLAAIPANSSPATLLGIFCTKFALSERAMRALLELVRLEMDFTSVSDVAQILNASGAPPVFLKNACATCHAESQVEDPIFLVNFVGAQFVQ